MAYKYKLAFSAADRSAILAELWTQLGDMGWTLHDNQDGSSYRVYKSNGELADRLYEYIKIDWITSNKIQFNSYYDWNATSHTGTGKGQTYGELTTQEATQTVWFFGSKNMVWVYNKISSTWYGVGFGHMPKKFFPSPETSLTTNATSGSNVTITVSSTAGFVAGQAYQIVGGAGEGRDWVTVGSITNSTQMVISNLPRNYNSGSKIGVCPSTFGNTGNVSSSTINWYQTCGRSASGTSNSSYVESLTYVGVTPSMVDPDSRSNYYVLQPVYTSYLTEVNGYDDEYTMYGSSNAYTAEDIVYIGKQSSGTATSATSTTLVDSGKSWTTDAFIGKVIIITGGTGAGQVRKITDNDGTSVTVATWDITPSTDSTYVIADECFMLMASAWAHRIGV